MHTESKFKTRITGSMWKRIEKRFGREAVLKYLTKNRE